MIECSFNLVRTKYWQLKALLFMTCSLIFSDFVTKKEPNQKARN